MKLRDLDKASGNPISLMPAFHIFWSRFENPETARRTRRSYEFVLKSSSALHFLTSPQQTTTVPVFRIRRRPCHPGCPVTFPVWAHHGDQHLRPCACHRPTSLRFLSFEQNQRETYHEVLIAGDLSEEDVRWVPKDGAGISLDVTVSTAEFVYGNETINFAQPSPSQFVPGGSGAGTFNPTLKMGLKGPPNDTPVLAGRNGPMSNTGAMLRYASSARWGYNSMTLGSF